MEYSRQEKAFYKATGDTPISPWELLKFRTYLMSTNNLWDLQMYVMTLVSIKLFLREEEIGGMRINHFMSDLFVINDSGDINKSMCRSQR